MCDIDVKIILKTTKCHGRVEHGKCTALEDKHDKKDVNKQERYRSDWRTKSEDKKDDGKDVDKQERYKSGWISEANNSKT